MDLAKLFGSQCRKKLLEKFILEHKFNAEAGFFIRELARDVEEQVTSVRRELQNLEDLGILRARTHDQKKVYRLNADCPVVVPLTSIFTAYFDALGAVRDFFKKRRGVELLVVAGEISDMSVKATNNVVDIFVIGAIDKAEFNDFLAKHFFGRKIRYAVMTREDLEQRLSYGDKLIVTILKHRNNVYLKDALGIRERFGIAAEEAKAAEARPAAPSPSPSAPGYRPPQGQFRMPL